jgi:hypothetical protein
MADITPLAHRYYLRQVEHLATSRRPTGRSAWSPGVLALAVLASHLFALALLA